MTITLAGVPGGGGGGIVVEEAFCGTAPVAEDEACDCELEAASVDAAGSARAAQ